jgi:riboflavin kinase/FMN adenylyltransferase
MQGPEEFIEEVLVRRIGVQEVVVGPNYAFGKGRQGNVARLMELGERWKFRVWVVESMMRQGVRVSSSMIRECLKNGDVERGADLLGREYQVEGVVVPGHQRGEKLGFPTANLAKTSELLPKEGVYAVRVDHAGKLLDAIAYVGSQPTFQGKEVGLEVHLLNFTGEIYQERLRVYFVAWLRPEKVFENREALVAQIRQDVEKARGILQSPRRDRPK